MSQILTRQIRSAARAQYYSKTQVPLSQKDRPAIQWRARTPLSSNTEQIVHEIGSENMNWNDPIFGSFLPGLQKM